MTRIGITKGRSQVRIVKPGKAVSAVVEVNSGDSMRKHLHELDLLLPPEDRHTIGDGDLWGCIAPFLGGLGMCVSSILMIVWLIWSRWVAEVPQGVQVIGFFVFFGGFLYSFKKVMGG